MDTDRLEVIGLKPLRDLLGEFGGWPVVDGDTWDEDEFDWLVVVQVDSPTESSNGFINVLFASACPFQAATELSLPIEGLQHRLSLRLLDCD